jgi:serine/threonine protein phosphatase PrpC
MEAVLYLDRERKGPTLTPFADGEVVVVTRRGPDKAVNEDALALLPYPGGGTLVLTDGMGGQNAGERASRLTLETIAGRLEEAAAQGQALRHALVDGVEAANRAVREMGLGAGATLAAVILNQGRARSLHVGDAVAAHLGQRGRVKGWTLAHSPTSYAVEAGLLDEEEAMHHDDRHLVTNFVGDEGMRLEVGPAQVVARRDTLLLASDGLVDNLRPEEVIELARAGPLERAAARLLELAQDRMAGREPGGPCKPDDLTLAMYRRSC